MLNAFTLWIRMMDATLEMSRTGQRVSETLGASHDVIDARSGMIRTALASPLEADHVELARMVPEKIAAFSQAGTAIATQWWAIQADLLTQAHQLGTMALKGRPPTASELKAMTARNIAHGTRAIERSVALGAGAVKPVHARATSNARRLKRAKKR
ncbi:hypothetical protein [Polymorphobacter sp.]|uniref:hypothetical protein n=1 Tax=Polymorphobacter sp. TaxID=1909290 RepID=UPI003F6EC9CB